MSTPLTALVRNAFLGMAQGPRPLRPALTFYAAQERLNSGKIETELLKRLSGNPNDELRELWNGQLKHWDWESAAPWSAATKSNTRARRDRIYDLLQLSKPLRLILNAHVPFYEGADNVLIEGPQTKAQWYTYDLRVGRDFYWKRFKRYLGTTRNMTADSISSIDASTTMVMSLLADPASANIQSTRGLVVGHVQSGKTTNFTGVVAKAIDVGYRLIVILSGTTNLLRNQTQRRLDMDIVGVENILRGADEEEADHDYKDDEGWPDKFTSYGKRPSLLGHVDLLRLTGHSDFHSADAGLNPLDFEFEKKDRLKPLYHAENLSHASARIIVLKKQRDRLSRLLRELRAVGKSKCAEVPTLVIDDESDQASINTLDPRKVTDQARTAISERIVGILKQLPRSQYIGYTATPFANVFVSPRNPADIYPRDFILSLEPPDHYMGAKAFHDFDSPAPGKLSNEKAHIRDVPHPKTHDDRLVEAIDAFVLTGALKKYRERLGGSSGPSFKHHTMLVHQSHLQGDHAAAADQIRSLWKASAYHSPGPSHTRLRALFEEFATVWADRGKDHGYLFPKHFSQLHSDLGSALTEIRKGDPVLVVNSADGADVPDFDKKAGVWKVIVGGTKLSRGYTVEGLTISYFRRRAKMQDTLLQMGRWFGYRLGYDDLVRLYIGRAESDGKNAPLDLYKAFESICRDEEAFRSQLAMYGGSTEVTPEKIPALVFNSHPRLRPTSRNKMFHTEVTWAAFDRREPTQQAASEPGRSHNVTVFSALLGPRPLAMTTVSSRKGKTAVFTTKWVRISHSDLVRAMGQVQWEKAGAGISAELEYLRRKECRIKSWLVLAPQLKEDSQGGTWKVGRHDLHCITRTKVSLTRFGVFSTPDHINFAKWLVGVEGVEFKSPNLHQSKDTGVLLLYPTYERNDRGKAREDLTTPPVMGFALVLPPASLLGPRIAFRVKK
jgi:hypothetical protein